MRMMKACDLPDLIPLFPLPGALLLPRGRLPLHIFEPRYLQMVEDCLKTPHRLIGMIQPCKGRDGTAKLNAIGCAGRLTGFSETEDGRYMITLSGISRFRLLREQGAWLDARRKPGESRPAALRRLAKMPDMPPNAKLTGDQRP